MNKNISYGGMATALSVILLIMAGYLPSGRAAALFLASLTVFVMCAITNKKTALIIYAAVTLLSVLIAPSALTILLSYGICFGNYPVLKLYIEMKKQIVIQFILKAVLYTLYFFSVYSAFRFLAGIEIPYALYILYIGGVLVFVFYDWLLSQTGIYVLRRFFKRF